MTKVNFPVEKPCTPAELAHFGTKGMKWGVRKTQGTRDFYEKHPTSEQRTAAITKARANVSKAKEAFKTAEKGSEKRKDLKDVYLNHPDRATALRLTRGEKVVFGLIMGVPTPASLGLQVGLTARVGKRRAIEK